MPLGRFGLRPSEKINLDVTLMDLSQGQCHVGTILSGICSVDPGERAGRQSIESAHMGS